MVTRMLHGLDLTDSQQFNEESIYSLNRFAAWDIAKRTLAGPFICLFGMLITVPLTSILDDATVFTFALITLLSLSALFRVSIFHSLKKVRDADLEKWKRITSLAILSTSGIWGIYLAVNFYLYQLTIATMVILVFTVAIAAGVAISIFIWKKLAQLCVVVIFLPAYIVLAFQWSGTALSIILGMNVYLVFLYIQIIRSNKEYWGALCSNKLLESNAKELEEARYLAEEANRAKSEFLSSMSHELRTPLNSIMGFTQIMATDPDDPPSKEHLQSLNYIYDGGKHLLELIDQVLDLAKIESGKMDLKLQKVSLSNVLNECHTFIEILAKENNIALNFEDTKYTVWADHMRLKQVLLNLISNGIKYNISGGILNVTYQDFPDTIKISISDTGQGIPETHQHLIFSSFNRLGHEKSKIQGTGVGLTISKSLIEAMDGQIGFLSEQDKGSTFWVELPKA
ncbi:MAG: ATP-binding protein [Gammaproteobacteria bacterium]|nr:ATP-binding protein [Gammaproteobacteria bacterium]MDH5591363.1 ATP-binding protein [Gammaproteobacteria bacterium]